MRFFRTSCFMFAGVLLVAAGCEPNTPPKLMKGSTPASNQATSRAGEGVGSLLAGCETRQTWVAFKGDGCKPGFKYVLESAKGRIVAGRIFWTDPNNPYVLVACMPLKDIRHEGTVLKCQVDASSMIKFFPPDRGWTATQPLEIEFEDPLDASRMEHVTATIKGASKEQDRTIFFQQIPKRYLLTPDVLGDQNGG